MSAKTSEDHNVAGMLGAKRRERGFDEIYLGEENGFELVAHEILRRRRGRQLFYGSNNSYFQIIIS